MVWGSHTDADFAKTAAGVYREVEAGTSSCQECKNLTLEGLRRTCWYRQYATQNYKNNIIIIIIIIIITIITQM
jgi:hypothetical protein